ncbi:flagellar biosynthetic protein FliO [Shewanella sp. C32]|uniref:Flagellar protein n=1 Tax=Shewanella electrica TaxID=515560 RepID=A0ABT2FJH1_9GAMM|nr:flagellar biosynthetic protein FliO [Shewanella electrica]MCH1924579.1 flagellar biosynthetic protein FliO [Shewanella electrica]MCS4556480.1 flagellar biosynthetic protein FliO [Shewanella electrica]
MLTTTILSAAAAATTTPVRNGVDYSSIAGMFGGLLVVLMIIIALAYGLKKLNLTTNSSGAIKVQAQTAMGPKERLVLVAVGEQQYLLGVTAQQVSLIDKLDTPVTIETSSFSQRLKQARANQQ